MWLRRIGFLGVVTLVLAGCLSAQSPNGIINGLVLDPTGGTVPGAEIRIANDATGVQYTGKTNERRHLRRDQSSARYRIGCRFRRSDSRR